MARALESAALAQAQALAVALSTLGWLFGDEAPNAAEDGDPEGQRMQRRRCCPRAR